MTWRREAGEEEKAALTAGREHLSSWHCGYIPSQDASLARERSGLTEKPTGKCWCLAPVETQDYMRPYTTLCARAAVYLSPLGFSSMWQDFLFFPSSSLLRSYFGQTARKQEKLRHCEIKLLSHSTFYAQELWPGLWFNVIVYWSKGGQFYHNMIILFYSFN